MSDLIKREDVLKVTDSHWFRDMPKVSRRFLDTFWVAVNKIPAVDAVEVVRCFQCLHRDEDSKICKHPKAIGWDAIEPEDDDFCSYGERRGENAVD